MFAGKFRGDIDPKQGLHPSNCLNHRERRILEFLMPIFNLDKPKWIILTMGNTLLGFMSGVRPVNWGLLIHKVVGHAIHHIGRKPSFLSPFILHLYQHFDCIIVDEEDILTIASEEVAYKLHSEVGDAKTETSGDPIILEAPPSSTGNPLPSIRRPNSPPPPPPHHHPEAGPSWETTWQNVDIFAWDFPENPFRRVKSGLEDLHTQYFQLEHIARGANQTLDNCGPRNILRELAKKADKKELDRVNTENSHLNEQVAAMI